MLPLCCLFSLLILADTARCDAKMGTKMDTMELGSSARSCFSVQCTMPAPLMVNFSMSGRAREEGLGREELDAKDRPLSSRSSSWSGFTPEVSEYSLESHSTSRYQQALTWVSLSSSSTQSPSLLARSYYLLHKKSKGDPFSSARLLVLGTDRMSDSRNRRQRASVGPA